MATTTTTPSVSSIQCPAKARLTFLTLPIELRITIYEHLFAGGTIFVWSALRFRQASIYWRHSLNQQRLLFTCSQIFAEVRPVLYQRSVWDISSAAASGFGSDARCMQATPYIERIKVVSGRAIDYLSLDGFTALRSVGPTSRIHLDDYGAEPGRMSDEDLAKRIMADHDVKRIDMALREGTEKTDIKIVVEIAWDGTGDCYRKCMQCFLDTKTKTITRGHRTK